VIRATFGTWFNYATTLLFQVLFAIHYGSSNIAVAFIIAFGIGVAISGLVGSSIQSAVLPRLVAPDGGLVIAAVRFMAMMTAVAAGLSLTLVMLAGPSSQLLASHASVEAPLMGDLLRITGIFLLAQVVAGEATVISLARGHRLVPAIGPAFPSLAAGAGMVILPGIDIRLAYLLLTIGTILQIAVVFGNIGHSVHFQGGALPRMGAVTTAMFVSFALLAAIVPIERIVAAGLSTASSAHYDYAMRSLRVAQQLILGGLLLTALGDWSARASRVDLGHLRKSLGAAIVLGGSLLFLAASVAAVSGHSIVALVSQPGPFAATAPV